MQNNINNAINDANNLSLNNNEQIITKINNLNMMMLKAIMALLVLCKACRKIILIAIINK